MCLCCCGIREGLEWIIFRILDRQLPINKGDWTRWPGGPFQFSVPKMARVTRSNGLKGMLLVESGELLDGGLRLEKVFPRKWKSLILD